MYFAILKNFGKKFLEADLDPDHQQHYHFVQAQSFANVQCIVIACSAS